MLAYAEGIACQGCAVPEAVPAIPPTLARAAGRATPSLSKLPAMFAGEDEHPSIWEPREWPAAVSLCYNRPGRGELARFTHTGTGGWPGVRREVAGPRGA